MTELIALRDQALAAALAAATAQVAAEAATSRAAAARAAQQSAADTLAQARSRLTAIEQSIASIPGLRAQIDDASATIAGLSASLLALDGRIAQVKAQIDRARSTFPFLVPPALIRTLAQLQGERAALDAQRQLAQVTLGDAQQRLTAALADADQRDAARAAVTTAARLAKRAAAALREAQQDAQSATAAAVSAAATATALADQFQAALDHLLADLDPEIPIALLPVRLETRFHVPVARQPPTELLVRIYPDDVHKDTHETGLTDVERAMAEHFWRETWRAGLAAAGSAGATERRAQELGAWRQLVERFGAARAAYLAARLEPVNLVDRPTAANLDPAVPLVAEPQFDSSVPSRASSWTRPALARALPDRWLVIGTHGGQVSSTTWGDLIPPRVAVGPDPSATAGPTANAVPVDPGMRWMVDFAAAEAIGMGVRVGLSAADAVQGFDRVVVLGVRGTLADPADGATELQSLLEAHHHTWGAGFVAQGTPTNNTETVTSGHAHRADDAETSFERERVPDLIAADDGSDGARTALALGLASADVAHLAGADGRDQRDAELMNRVLWPATLGYFLEQFLAGVLPGYERDPWAEFFAVHVHGRGPIPTVRVGRQPYGILPVTSLDRWAGSRPDLVGVLIRLRQLWATAVPGTARAARGAPEAGRDLVETLGLEAISSSYSWRWARGPRFFDLFWALPGLGTDPAAIKAADETLARRVTQVLADLGLEPDAATRLTGTTFARIAFDWPGPFVDPAGASETDGLAENYLAALADPKVPLGDVHAGTGLAAAPQPLLLLLARQATLLAYADQILRTSWPAPPTSTAAPWFDPELVDIDPVPSRDVPGDRTRTPTFWRALQDVPGGGTVAVGDQLRALGRRVAEPLRTFLAALAELAGRPTAVLERLLGESLDLASHRLDAWITAVPTQRLAEIRSRRPTGVYLGGYGWVEDLRPRGTAPLSDGYLHAPSVAQATAAAVMLSGHLSHTDQPPGAQLELDLSSRRVRVALELIDGVRQGQPLGALLGYRLERTLADAGPALGRTIARLRALAPLNGGRLVATDPSDPPEAVAAGNVVDGLKLLEQYRAAAFAVTDFGLTGAEQSILEAALNEVADALDAVGDLGVAEGVYQAVKGNYLRAGASLDAISRGESPGEIEFVRTPQAGPAITHRVVALLDPSASTPPASAGSWTSTRARALAEPALERLAATILGDPARVRCTVTYVNPDGDPAAPDASADLRLSALDICALDLVYAPPTPPDGGSTELELRLAHAALRQANRPAGVDENASIGLTFVRSSAAGESELTVPELLEVVRVVKDLITNGRAIDARDLDQAGSTPNPGVDVAALVDRVNAALTSWADARDALRALFEVAGAPNLLDLAADPTLQPPIDLAAAYAAIGPTTSGRLESLRAALEALGAYAVQGAAPSSAGGSSDAVLADLVRQAAGVDAQVRAIDRRLAAVADGPGAVITAALARLAVLFGEGFRVLPPFSLDTGHPYAAAQQRRKQAGDALPAMVVPWLQRAGRVRDGVRRLSEVITYAEVLGTTGALAVTVAQLPADEHDRWDRLGGPTAETGATSVVAYAPDTLDPAGPLAGLFVDSWVEVVPQPTIQTSLAFHHDAPGGQAPQAILLAVSPDPSRPWDEATLGAVLSETFDLAQLRTVDHDAAPATGQLLPGLLFANNRGGDPAGDTVSTAFGR